MPMLKELREKQARITTNARAKFDEITNDTPEARASEIEREFDAMMADADKIGGQITRLEKLEEAEARANRGDTRRPRGEDGRAEGAQDEQEALNYRGVFHKFLQNGADISALEPEERNVLRAGKVSTDVEKRIQTAGTAAAGGFTVPTELASIIVRTMKDWGPMYDEDICTVLNTASGNPIKLPTIDDTAKSGAKRAEGDALTDDGGEDVVFGQKSLDAFVYDTEFVRFSMELAQDSIFNMEALLGSLLGERLARIANRELTIGDGTGDPNGVVTAAGAGKTAASATAITSDEIIDLLHSVNAAYRRSPKARFMFADTTLAVIRKLKDGQGNYLWQMGDVTAGQPGTLLGYKYAINDDMPSIAAAKKVILFGDFSKYFVRKVGAPMIGVLRERFWPDLGIAGLIRFDGELGDAAAIKALATAAS
jgi:HK97 family phage major capsid protein